MKPNTNEKWYTSEFPQNSLSLLLCQNKKVGPPPPHECVIEGSAIINFLFVLISNNNYLLSVIFFQLQFS